MSNKTCMYVATIPAFFCHITRLGKSTCIKSHSSVKGKKKFHSVKLQWAFKSCVIGFFWEMVIHNLSVSSSPIHHNNFYWVVVNHLFGLLDPWCFSWLLFTCYTGWPKNNGTAYFQSNKDIRWLVSADGVSSPEKNDTKIRAILVKWFLF